MSLTPLYLTSHIREIERLNGAAGLMEKAGLAVATLARDLLTDSDDTILVIAGPGNNGGDALVAARHLRQDWHRVVVVFAGDMDKLPADAAKACEAWLTDGGTLETEIPHHLRYRLVIDGLFGIGLKKPLEGSYAELVGQINALPCPVLSIDIPSGLCADTGRVLGCAVKATHTVTFLAAKPGLYTLDGPDHAGLVHLRNLGVDTSRILKFHGWLMESGMFQHVLPPRKRNSHKGTYGNVVIIGGSDGMTGAAILASRAALLIGSGRVYASMLAKDAPLLDPAQPELMLRRAGMLHTEIQATCAVLGPGLGRSADALNILKEWLQKDVPLVLDADALQLIALNPALQATVKQRKATTITTPHPGEAASLLGCSSAEVQQDRIHNALKLAESLDAITVLKGAGTIVAMPEGHWAVNPTGNPGLASAGTGDVLAGIMGGLIAQGLEVSQAARFAVYLHGAAADALVEEGIGPVGLTASEVALKARDLLNREFA